MNAWDETYQNARRLFRNAMGYYNINSKSRELKRAWNAVRCLPDGYIGKDALQYEIERYAESCEIDLTKVTGY